MNLDAGKNTCIIYKDYILVFSSEKRGVAPLMDFIKESQGTNGYMLADKVIGKAAALLCLKAGISIVYSNIISTAALEILGNNGIPVAYDKEVPAIQNRTRTGFCPMEGLSEGISDPDAMYDRIVKWLASK